MTGVRSRPPLVLPSPPRAPYRSFRAREFPSFGVDHYDAIPDDLAEDELEGGLSAPEDGAALADDPPSPSESPQTASTADVSGTDAQAPKASPLPRSETTA
jgi:hypothetical protein